MGEGTQGFEPVRTMGYIPRGIYIYIIYFIWEGRL